MRSKPRMMVFALLCGSVLLVACRSDSEGLGNVAPDPSGSDSGGAGNTAPVANDQSVKVAPGASVAIVLSATDADGDSLTYDVKSPPAHGALSGTAPNLIYATDATYAGTDDFTFTASDGKSVSNVATVTIRSPVPGARTIYDDLPEISPWRRKKWSDVYAGPAQSSADLQQLLDGACGSDQPKAEIPAGLYNAASTLDVNGCHNKEISAFGVMLIVHHNGTMMHIRDSSELVIKGMTIDIGLDNFHYVQGTVAARTDDAIDVVVHEGYPAVLPDEGTVAKVTAYESDSLLLKPGVWTTYGNRYQKTGEFTYRVEGAAGNISTNDYVALVLGGGHGIVVRDTVGLTMEDVTIHAARMFSIIDVTGTRNTYRRVRVTPGPMPDGASVPRLKSGNFDGIHFKSMNGDMVVEDTLIECNGDDGLASNTPYQVILGGSGATLDVTEMSNYAFSVGETVYLARLADMGIAGEAEIVSIEEITESTTITSLKEKAAEVASTRMPGGSRGAEDLLENDRYYRITLDKDIAVVPGDLVASRDRNSGLVIRRNMIRNARARGMMLKASNMTIEANVVAHKMDAALSIHPELWWYESGHSNNVVIQGNLFTDNGFGPGKGQKVVDIKSAGIDDNSPAGALKSFVIKDNVFDSNYDIPIGVVAVSDLEIANNEIAANRNELDCMIALTNCADVKISNNSADNETFSLAKEGVCRENVTDITLDDPIVEK